MSWQTEVFMYTDQEKICCNKCNASVEVSSPLSLSFLSQPIFLTLSRNDQ